MPLSRRRKVLLVIVLGFLAGVIVVLTMYRRPATQAVAYVAQRLQGRATVADRLAEHGDASRARLRPHFNAAGVPYPPDQVVLVGLKSEKLLRVYSSYRDAGLKLIREYPVLAASGKSGPKLREGDEQVPEGIYHIDYLNPNSMFHLSLGLDYPNRFDKARAQEENRRQLGGAIMIHGNEVSVGCLAIGDEAAEDLFVLAAETGKDNVKVILAPNDLRYSAAPADAPEIDWLPDLYNIIRAELNKLPE